jgi:hypothetical protein
LRCRAASVDISKKLLEFDQGFAETQCCSFAETQYCRFADQGFCV